MLLRYTITKTLGFFYQNLANITLKVCWYIRKFE